MKVLTLTGLTELIAKIKNQFIDKNDTITATLVGVDSVPTTSSSNLITSGGVYSYHDDTKANKFAIKTTMDSIANVDTQYYLGEQSSVSFTLPSATAGQKIIVVFYSGATATSLSISGTMLGTIPTPQANQRIELNILFDGTNWCLLSNTMGTN